MTEPRRFIICPVAQNNRRGRGGFHNWRIADIRPVQYLHRGRYQRHAHAGADQADGSLQFVGPLRHLGAQAVGVEQRDHMVGITGARVAGVQYKRLGGQLREGSGRVEQRVAGGQYRHQTVFHQDALDDGTDGAVPLFMRGQVRDTDGNPLAGAIVDVWQANTGGTYSWFDSSQSEFNLRRRIETDAQGNYRFRSIVPSGYACPPTGPTQRLLDQLGRHGQRPAHIHFFISAPGYRHLTTQINLSDDPYLPDDFAYATRDELIAEIRFSDDPQLARELGVQGRFAQIDFDFELQVAVAPAEQQRMQRVRALED